MAKLNKQAVKKTGRERKEVMVAELTKKIDETNGLVFTDYKGLTHLQLETLKRELKKDDATMIVAKNSLMKISLGNSKNYKDAKDNEALAGSMATLFIKGDMVEPLKKLQKVAKEAGLPKVKFGILEGQILDEAGVLKIASLPGRETLLTQLAAMLNSPIQGFVSGLNSIPQKFVMTLDAIAKTKPDKPEGAASASPADEAAKPDEATTEAQSEVSDDTPEPAEETPAEGPTESAEADQNLNPTESQEETPVEATTENTTNENTVKSEDEKPTDSNEDEEKEGGEK